MKNVPFMKLLSLQSQAYTKTHSDPTVTCIISDEPVEQNFCETTVTVLTHEQNGKNNSIYTIIRTNYVLADGEVA